MAYPTRKFTTTISFTLRSTNFESRNRQRQPRRGSQKRFRDHLRENQRPPPYPLATFCEIALARCTIDQEPKHLPTTIACTPSRLSLRYFREWLDQIQLHPRFSGRQEARSKLPSRRFLPSNKRRSLDTPGRTEMPLSYCKHTSAVHLTRHSGAASIAQSSAPASPWSAPWSADEN